MSLERSRLRELVRSASQEVRRSGDRLQLLRLSSISPPPESTPVEIRALYEFVIGHPTLRIFNGGYFYGPDGARRVEAPQLLDSLLAADAAGNLDSQLDDLERYLDAVVLPYRHRTLIAGVKSAESREILPGIHFVPWGIEHSTDPVALDSADRLAFAPGLVELGGTLDVPFEWPKNHIASYTPIDRTPPSLPSAEGLLTCLQVLGQGGVYPLVSWYSAPSWCPVAGGVRAMHIPPHRCDAFELTAQSVVVLRQHVEGYRSLASQIRRALEFAIGRLNQARGQWSIVEKAIDLRIAFEMMFCIGEQRDEKSNQELRFRLALRAARWLGADADERAAIFASARRLYDIGSAAVHSGTLSEDWENPEVDLNGGAALIRRAASRILLEGPPNWTKVSIG